MRLTPSAVALHRGPLKRCNGLLTTVMELNQKLCNPVHLYFGETCHYDSPLMLGRVKHEHGASVGCAESLPGACHVVTFLGKSVIAPANSLGYSQI
jgi:hypothetical protein